MNMRQTLMAVLITACLLLAGCGGDSGTGPQCCVTLVGTWVGTHGDLTVRITVDSVGNCSQQYGYCEASGTGSYARTGGSSGPFNVSGQYFRDTGQSVVLFLSGFASGATTEYGGVFEAPSRLRGTLGDMSAEQSPLGVSAPGVPMTLTRQ